MTVSPGTVVPGTIPANITHCTNLASRETIWIKDDTGQVIRTLVDGTGRPGGCSADVWDGRDDSGVLVPPGEYSADIEAIHVHVNARPPMDRFVPLGSGVGNVWRVRGLAYNQNLLYILSNDNAGTVKVVAYRPDLSFANEWTVTVDSRRTDAVANPMGLTADVDGLLYILSYKDVGPMALRVNAWEADASASDLAFLCELSGSLSWVPHDPDFAPLAYDPFVHQIISWGEQWETPDDKAFVLDASCGPFVCNLDPSPGGNQYMGASGMAVDGEGNVWVATGTTLRKFEHLTGACGPIVQQINDTYSRMRLAARYGRLIYWMIGSELQIHDLRGQYLTAICLNAAGFIDEEERFVATPEGEYVFAVGRPCDQGGNALKLVRVQDFNSATIRSQPLSVVCGVVSVNEPTSGEYWVAGTTRSIRWASVGCIGNVTIRLFSGATEVPGVSPIAVDTPNNGEFDWAIPASLPFGQDYLVQIEDAGDPSLRDASDSSLTIVAKLGDVDGDGVLTLGDYSAMPQCVRGPSASVPVGVCQAFDSEPNGKVDLADFARFQQGFGR